MKSHQPPLFRPIGKIRSPHKNPVGTPIQPTYAASSQGLVLLDPPFEDALNGIEGFQRLWLLYLFDRADPFQPLVIPYRDNRPRGLFATRAPSRPNPIGMSVVRLLGRDGLELRVAGLDVLDDTPLLDIKPYVPAFDAHPSSAAGWLDEQGEDRRVADQRFHHPDRS